MADHLITLSSGRKLGYAEYGDPGGALAFYFHGWPSSRLQGELMDAVGKARGLRVIAPDRPGIGTSDFHAERTLLDWPPLIEELAAHFNAEKFFVLGVSGGGPYALVCAHSIPQHLLGVAVVCGAPPLKEVGTRELFWVYKLGLWAQRWLPFTLGPGLRLSSWVAARKFDQWPQTWLSGFYSAEDRRAMLNPDKHRIMMESGLIALRSPVRAVRLDGMLYSSDWKFDLGSITKRVRFWHGGQDRNILAVLTQRAADKMPDATFTTFPQDGHYSIALLRMEEIVDAMLAEAQ